MVAQSADPRTPDHAAQSVPEAALPTPAPGLSRSRQSPGLGLGPVRISALTAGLPVRGNEIGLDSVLLLHLRLAIARGFSDAMHARLAPSHTPGGGLTMTLTFPVST